MNPNTNEIYQEVIDKLKKGARPQIRLTPEILNELKMRWEEAISGGVDQKEQSSMLKKILCILDNSQTTTSELNDLFFRTFKEIKDSEIIIYCLSASQKHVIADSLKTGKMISFEFFEILKTLLLDRNPEVKEWALRTIESLGPMSLRLKADVLSAKPGIMKLFNQHQKASAQIIDYLEAEWKRMKL